MEYFSNYRYLHFILYVLELWQRKSVYFLIVKEEYSHMKRNLFKLLSVNLAFLIVALFTPTDVYAKDYVLADDELFYEEYFENEHGFYSDNITKSQNILYNSHRFLI